MRVGYKLVNKKGDEVAAWGGIWGQCPDIPNPLRLPVGPKDETIDVCGVSGLGPVAEGFTLESWDMEEPVVIPSSITRRQCALQLYSMGMITGSEALDMARNGTPPGIVAAYIMALKTEDERVHASIDFASTDYRRDNPLLGALIAAQGKTSEEADQFFIAAGAR